MKDEELSLKEALKNINKKYGAETIAEVGDNDERAIVEGVSTNCYSLDRVFGEIKGMPRGRIIDIYGDPSGGKTTLAMYLVAQIQKNGGKAAWLDAEYAFVSEYAIKVGINTKELLLCQPRTGEEALDIVETLVKTGEMDIIVIDSTAALVPEKELEGEISDSSIAMQARLLSKGLRMITGVASRSKTVIVFISQIRDKIGSFVGPTTDSTGGRALKFYSSVRLKVDKIKTHKSEEAVIGNRLKIEATKNKVGLPFRVAELDLFFGKGIDVVGDLLDVAVSKGLIDLNGRTYSCGDIKLGTSRDDAKSYLENNSETLNAIKETLNKN